MNMEINTPKTTIATIVTIAQTGNEDPSLSSFLVTVIVIDASDSKLYIPTANT
jgi:hypothetical protein